MEKAYTVHLLVLLLLLSVYYTHEQSSGEINVPFILDTYAEMNCSWSFYEDEVEREQPCRVLPYDKTGDIGICNNPLPYPEDEHDRAAPVSDLQIEEITKSLNILSNSEENEDYTCIRITYKILRRDTEEILGIQFSLRSKEENTYFCQNHVYSNGLMYWSVVNSCSITTCDRKVFVHEAFCGIIPGSRYDVSVRTLPVDYSHSNSPFDTKETKEYPAEAISRSQNCGDKPNDVRCKLNKEANWTSDYVQVQPDNSWNFPDYVNLSVIFSVAPADFQFNTYTVVLYKVDGEMDRYKDGKNVNNPQVTEEQHLGHSFNVTRIRFDNVFIPSCYKVKIQPDSNRCKRGINKRHVLCATTQAEISCPTANPCSTYPCGQNGKCTSSNGMKYTCSCDAGFVFYNGTCLKNPCLNDTGQDISLCGSNGTCNFVMPEREISMSYNCTCDFGYDNVTRKCIGSVRDMMESGQMTFTIIAIVIGSLGGIGLLVIVVVIRKSVQGHKKQDAQAPQDFFRRGSNASFESFTEAFKEFGDAEDVGVSSTAGGGDHVNYGYLEQSLNSPCVDAEVDSDSSHGTSYSFLPETSPDPNTGNPSPSLASAHSPAPDGIGVPNTDQMVLQMEEEREPVTLFHSEDMQINSADTMTEDSRSMIPYSDIAMASHSVPAR